MRGGRRAELEKDLVDARRVLAKERKRWAANLRDPPSTTASHHSPAASEHLDPDSPAGLAQGLTNSLRSVRDKLRDKVLPPAPPPPNSPLLACRVRPPPPSTSALVARRVVGGGGLGVVGDEGWGLGVGVQECCACGCVCALEVVGARWWT
jgi:hypothetical protein